VKEDFKPPTREKDDPDGGFWHGLKLVVGNRSLLSLFSVRVLVRLAVRTLGPTLPLFIQSLVPASTRVASLAGLVSGTSAATSAVGAVTLGRASDRIGYRKVLLVCASITAILYVPQFFVTAPWQLIVLQGAVGLVISGVLASISALLANLAPEGHQGAVFGVDSSAVAMANGIGPMLGASVAAWMGLRAPFLLAAGALALAAVLAGALLPKTPRTPAPTAAE
jgi:DHA1 family multidrug resistance protein-like MFS transporter